MERMKELSELNKIADEVDALFEKHVLIRAERCQVVQILRSYYEEE